MIETTAINPLEVLSGGNYTLPEDPKLLRVLVVQTARMVAGKILRQKDAYEEHLATFLDKLDSDHVELFNSKFRQNIDHSVEMLESEITLLTKYRRDWMLGMAQSKAGLKLLEGLKGLKKKEK